MPIGQGFVNAWLKVNSKHVVFPPINKPERDEQHNEKADETLSHTTKSIATATSVATAPTSASADPENLAIRRFNSRKHRRRLQRTISASDLLRDKAKAKGAAEKEPGVDELDGSNETKPSTSSNSASSPFAWDDSGENDRLEKAAVHLAQHDQEDILVSLETDTSLRFVAGFFGAEIDGYSSGRTDVPVGQDLVQKRKPTQGSNGKLIERAASDVSPLASGGMQSLSLRKQSSDNITAKKGNSNESRSEGVGGIAIRFPPNLFAVDRNQSKGHCEKCRELENELLGAHEDLEYLRGMALRNEYICRSCQSLPGKSREDGSQASPGTIKEWSQLLNEATARHKSQIEQLTRERVSLSFDCTCFVLNPGTQSLLFRARPGSNKILISSYKNLQTYAKI